MRIGFPLSLLALVAAAPMPNIDFDKVNPVGVTGNVVTYPPYDANRKPCDPQLTGSKSAPIVSPDTTVAFLNNAAISDAANAAPVPGGYVERFKNLKSSNKGNANLGYTLLDAYDTNLCAAKCNAVKGCTAFNIYYERTPSVRPGILCPVPSSVNMIKCVFWGGPVNNENAVNSGQWHAQFRVVIAGSNGYESTSVTTPAAKGFVVSITGGKTPGQYLGKDAESSTTEYALFSLVTDRAKAAAFNLDKTDSRLKLGDWLVQTAKSGEFAGAFGAAPTGFPNGDDILCQVEAGELKCKSKSAGRNVFENCQAWSWMSAEQRSSFCPEGTGSLKFMAIDV